MRVSEEDKELIKHVLDSWLAEDTDYAVCKNYYDRLWTRAEQPNRIPDSYICKSRLIRFVWDVWRRACNKASIYLFNDKLQKFYMLVHKYTDSQIETIITKHLLEKLSWLQETQ